jgi:hypothetical protein
MKRLKMFFTNVYVRTVLLVFLTGLAGTGYSKLEKSLTKAQEAQVADSANSKNIRNQFWDLFEDLYQKTNRLQATVDSLKTKIK